MKNKVPAFVGPRFADWAGLQYHLLWAYEGPAPVVARDTTSASADTSCWLIRKGSVVLKTKGQSPVVARAGQWAFVASPVRHQRFSEDAELLSLHFQLTWPGGVQVVERGRNVVVDAARIPGLEKAARPVVKLLARHFPGAGAFLPERRCDRTAYFKTQALLPALLNAYLDAQEALGHRSTPQAGPDERVAKAAMRLERMPVDRAWSEAGLNRELGLSRSHLHALFVAELGTTPRRYLERRRLAAAERLLGQTGRSVKAVAAELGFRHASHFCAWFRRLRGIRPSESRQKA